ncbi:hypothetical protein LIS82_23875 [Cytobacillus solani]|uniref:Uncharacterized protein n=1 Tax=Cytobacillus solani TaxID=1637975 RepID=A0A0Q3QUI5_9BACI|nr:hypothetical protein [Cytobacillus solani]KOP72077.1 hypothetical protein AMS60_22765 [Bacillus sp. FJAT-21945]KQL21264.1 hypothetical protein AN957_23665 [Cytobacillus solani]USK54548.1 hypothetical protein LIS82_23875 [Cytobacillus solani]
MNLLANKGYGIYDRVDIDMDDFMFLHRLAEKTNQLQKEISHWKKAFDNENKIAGHLQKKVECLEKELRSYQEIADISEIGIAGAERN